MVLLATVFLCLTTAAVSGEVGYFWHLTDIHWDMFAPSRENKCRRTSEGGDGGKYGRIGCDGTWELLESAVRAMYSVRGENIEFILWTGDGVKEGLNSEERLKGLENITLMLGHTFNSQFVFPVMGHTEPSLYKDLEQLWRQWLPSEALYTFERGGYYMIEQKSKKLRVIALNTNLWTVETGEEDPGGQWAWLESVLSKISVNKQTVYLAGHVAPGGDERQGTPPRLSLLPHHNEKYIEIVTKYSNIIKGQFFSHLHSDTFRVVYDNTGNPVSSIFLAPAISPKKTSSGFNNPGLRMYKFETDSGEILDYTQYYLDLPSANQKGKAEWAIEYNFTKYYDLHEISPEALHTLAQTFLTQEGKELFGKYWVANSVRVYKLPNNLAWVNAHYCAITQLDFSLQQTCLTTRASALEASTHLAPSNNVVQILPSTFLLIPLALIMNR